MEGELHFTIHAREKMERKHVLEEHVRQVIATPERRRIDPDVTILWGRIGRRRLKIVLAKGEPLFVITIAIAGEGG